MLLCAPLQWIHNYAIGWSKTMGFTFMLLGSPQQSASHTGCLLSHRVVLNNRFHAQAARWSTIMDSHRVGGPQQCIHTQAVWWFITMSLIHRTAVGWSTSMHSHTWCWMVHNNGVIHRLLGGPQPYVSRTGCRAVHNNRYTHRLSVGWFKTIRFTHRLPVTNFSIDCIILIRCRSISWY